MSLTIPFLVYLHNSNIICLTKWPKLFTYPMFSYIFHPWLVYNTITVQRGGILISYRLYSNTFLYYVNQTYFCDTHTGELTRHLVLILLWKSNLIIINERKSWHENITNTHVYTTTISVSLLAVLSHDCFLFLTLVFEFDVTLYKTSVQTFFVSYGLTMAECLKRNDHLNSWMYVLL